MGQEMQRRGAVWHPCGGSYGDAGKASGSAAAAGRPRPDQDMIAYLLALAG